VKKAGLVLGGILAFLAVVAGLALAATCGLPAAAESFFTRIAAGDVEGAWRATAAEFQAATPLAQFETFLRTSALGDYRSASWNSRSVENAVGRLAGTVAVRNGGRIPVELEFVKESGTWRVWRLRKTAAGVDAPSAKPAVPDTAEANRLVAAGISLLAEAIRQDDFTILHRGISDLWRAQTTPAELRGIFADFVEQGLDLTDVVQAEPVLTNPPACDADGVLGIAGTYRHALAPLHFRLRFIPENGAWKLIGIGAEM